MTQSIFAKLRVITLSNLHSFLDATKALNSIGEYEQYVRDLRTARDQLDDQAAASRGRKSFLTNQIVTNEAHAKVADEQIDILLGDDDPSNDRLAKPLQIKLDAAKAQIEAAKRELETVNAQVDKFDDAVQRIDTRFSEAEAKLGAMRAAEQGAKASEKAARALDGIDLGTAPDTSGVEARMAERVAVADNALNRGLDRVSGAVGGATSAEAAAEAALAQRRAKIAAKKAAETSPATA